MIPVLIPSTINPGILYAGHNGVFFNILLEIQMRDYQYSREGTAFLIPQSRRALPFQDLFGKSSLQYIKEPLVRFKGKRWNTIKIEKSHLFQVVVSTQNSTLN